jgi:Zn-finger nucleic acid-binding protein
MNCPNCIDVRLVSRRREWLNATVCPSCNGSWLEHNELERLLRDARQSRGMTDDDWHEEPRHARHHDIREREIERAWRDEENGHRRAYRRRSLFDQIKEFID